MILSLTPERSFNGPSVAEELAVLRPLTFSILSMLASSIVFNKNSSPCSLLSKERCLLQTAFSNSAANLLRVLDSTNEQSVLDKIVEMVHEQKTFIKGSPISALDVNEIESLMTNPLSLVMHMQDDSNQSTLNKRPLRFPEALKKPGKDLEQLKARIREFWMLRQMVLMLTEDYSQSQQMIKLNPMIQSSSTATGWSEGQTVQIDEKDSVEKILCNIRTN